MLGFRCFSLARSLLSLAGGGSPVELAVACRWRFAGGACRVPLQSRLAAGGAPVRRSCSLTLSVLSLTPRLHWRCKYDFGFFWLVWQLLIVWLGSIAHLFAISVQLHYRQFDIRRQSSSAPPECLRRCKAIRRRRLGLRRLGLRHTEAPSLLSMIMVFHTAYRIKEKLRRLKKFLVQWNKEVFKEEKNKIETVKLIVEKIDRKEENGTVNAREIAKRLWRALKNG
ncbi:hypothetical protein Ancab_000612 [Ancistrocladus abbreviatus]